MIELLVAAALSGQEFDGERIDCSKSGRNDMEMRVCFGWYLEREEARMARYLSAALNRTGLRRVEAADRAVARGEVVVPTQESTFIAASAAVFTAYRDLWCQGVYEAFGPGSARSMAETDCKFQMTHERTRMIWRDYLYDPFEAPVLPEPVAAAWKDEPVPPSDDDEG